MTELLKKAFEEASKLEGVEQDALAKWLLAELNAEYRWGETLAASQEQLASMADQALQEHREGRTQPLDPNKL